jgi:hypothetical protein
MPLDPPVGSADKRAAARRAGRVVTMTVRHGFEEERLKQLVLTLMLVAAIGFVAQIWLSALPAPLIRCAWCGPLPTVTAPF